MLSSRRVLCLAVVIDGEPAASLLPFVAAPDYSGVFVQASALARHSRALIDGASVGLLFHDPDTEVVDPLQVARLTVQATVERIERDTPRFEAARSQLTARIPSVEVTLELADFSVYRLVFNSGRYVAGFARAFDVTPEDFRDLSRAGAAE
jgi:putative heme iron utilization protein